MSDFKYSRPKGSLWLKKYQGDSMLWRSFTSFEYDPMSVSVLTWHEPKATKVVHFVCWIQYEMSDFIEISMQHRCQQSMIVLCSEYTFCMPVSLLSMYRLNEILFTADQIFDDEVLLYGVMCDRLCSSLLRLQHTRDSHEVYICGRRCFDDISGSCDSLLVLSIAFQFYL